MGESLESATMQQVVALIEQDSAVVRVLRSPSMYMAPEQVILMLVIDFQNELSTTDINQAINRIRETVQQQFPIIRQLFIEPGEGPAPVTDPPVGLLVS